MGETALVSGPPSIPPPYPVPCWGQKENSNTGLPSPTVKLLYLSSYNCRASSMFIRLLLIH